MTESETTCYKLTFNTDTFESMYKIDTTGVNYLAVFAEHFPVEFESTTHYLMDKDGVEVEPLHEYPEESHSEDDGKKVRAAKVHNNPNPDSYSAGRRYYLLHLPIMPVCCAFSLLLPLCLRLLLLRCPLCFRNGARSSSRA